MKRILILTVVIFVAGCTAAGAPEAGPGAGGDGQAPGGDDRIAALEGQVEDLEGQVSSLQAENDQLKAAGGSALCEVDFGNMKYQNPTSAIAILEGWFALQDQVQELQGSFPTEFWMGVQSLTHTIRYIHTDTGESATTSFLLYFEEAEWGDGLFWVTEQCWLDLPGD